MDIQVTGSPIAPVPPDDNSSKNVIQIIGNILWWCSIVPPAIAIIKGAVNGVIGEISDIINNQKKS